MIIKNAEVFNYMKVLIERHQKLTHKRREFLTLESDDPYSGKIIMAWLKSVDTRTFQRLWDAIFNAADELIEKGIASTESEMKDIINENHAIIDSKNPDYSLLQKIS